MPIMELPKACKEQGAELALTYLNDKFKKKLDPIAKELECEERLYPCDVTNPR